MRATVALAILAGMATAVAADPAAQSFPPDTGYKNTASVGLVTTLGPTGLFQNPTSGILPKNAFSFESCMALKETNGDHFQANGVLLTYGVTDWLELSGYGLFVYGLNPAAAGDADFQTGQVNVRARLVREAEVMPEITLGGIAGFGDDPLTAHSLFLAASKGFSLGERDVLRSVRLHAGIRQTWPELGEDITTGFFGLEVELVQHLFLVGEVNTEDDAFGGETPWSVGLQYKSNSFGFSAAFLQAPGETRETVYIGIGVSY